MFHDKIPAKSTESQRTFRRNISSQTSGLKNPNVIQHQASKRQAFCHEHGGDKVLRNDDFFEPYVIMYQKIILVEEFLIAGVQLH
jgi:hypothetical protein